MSAGDFNDLTLQSVPDISSNWDFIDLIGLSLAAASTCSLRIVVHHVCSFGPAPVNPACVTNADAKEPAKNNIFMIPPKQDHKMDDTGLTFLVLSIAFRMDKFRSSKAARTFSYSPRCSEKYSIKPGKKEAFL